MSVSYYGEFNQRKPEGVWHFLNRLLVLLIVLAVITGIICAFLPALHKMREQADHFENLKKELDVQTAIHTQHIRKVSLLEHDPDYVAVLYARDRLNMMKENETIFRIEQASPTPQKSRARSQ